MAKRQALLIVNRHGRHGRRDLAGVLAELSRSGYRVRVEYPQHRQAMLDLVRAHGRQVDLIMLGGGDGTLSAALPAVLDTGRPLAVLPLGTANDLARSLGIPLNPVEAASLVDSGRVIRIDLGRVNGRLFFNAASIGVGVHVTQTLSYEFKQRWGVLSYPYAVAQSLRQARPFTARIECDGREHLVKAIQLTVGNGRYYGGGMAVGADAAFDDQRLDVYCLRPTPWWRLLALAPALRHGRHAEIPELEHLRGRRVLVETSRPRMISADGELVSRTPAVFEVVPAALPVFVPADVSGVEGLRHVAQ